MKQIIFTMLLFFFSTFCVSAQQPEKQFEDSYTLLADMLENPEHYSFKKAVFSAENAYLEGALDTVLLNQKIRFLGSLSKAVSKAGILEYAESDKDKVSKWAAVFKVMTDTIPINNNGEIVQYIPFGYDFEDVFGHQTRENLFVSKLLATRKGNCHSLPYLYKILAEEIGSDAHLSLAPNHVYIKHRSQKDGYYNTELTSKIFPVDAWIMASGYIHIDAMRNSVFMKALGNKESIALVLVDLAENYNAKFPDNDGRFVLQCCELALQQYPHFSTALILRAETHYKQIEKEQDQAKHDLLFAALEKEYAYIHKLGYRDMPEDMYLNWLVSLKTERSKYENQNLSTFKGKKAAPKEEELSEKEKARRKKNIEAGNPFIKYGSTIPVATLSKGKYLEFHDLDSIVSIGTMRWQVDQKKIVGRVVRDSLDPDAQPVGNIAGRWISPDPLSEEFPSWSPYNYAMNNPINMIDPDGKYAVSVHYRMTVNAMIKAGFAKADARRIAHRASVYADHPSSNVLFGDNLTHATNHHYRDDIDYSATTNSQDEANSKWHSMMSNEESRSGMTHSQAKQRGLEFGWSNIFDQINGLDEGKLGQGLHALQDAYAHDGAETNEHLGFNLSSVSMIVNDMYGDTSKAELITQSAITVLSLFNKENKGANLKQGMQLDFNGMSKKQLEKVTKLLKGNGFTLQSTKEKGYYILE